MCGIAGGVDFIQGMRPAVLTAMTRVLGRRGPDGHGIQVDGPCGFAHTRLSIIDLEGSPQPMGAPELGVSMVFNGEIYNYRELRRALQASGETFHTNGDGEVLLRSVARSWVNALPTLDAMFAFAVWDNRHQRLLLARDALGEKPLYYATPAPGVLVFGSEIKALFEHPAVKREMDLDSLRQALRFRAVYGANTLHEGVRQLEPGSYLEFSRTGIVSGQFYDLLEEAAAAGDDLAGLSDGGIIARGRELFMQSVADRMVADVPVGAFLSGGLDSSLIAAAMKQLRGPGSEVRTFAAGFADDPNSELPHAQFVADAIGTVHRAVLVGPETYARRLAELSACRDGLVSQPADVAVAEMSAAAKQDVKVALSGEGADEIFAGYPKYAFAKAPWALRGALRAVGADAAVRIAQALGLDGRRARVAATALCAPREVDREAQWFASLCPQDLARLLPGLGWSASQCEGTLANHAQALSRVNSTDPLLRMQAADCLTWLPGNMLERDDRMSMAEGLEVRQPFLSKQMCAFGLGLPDRLKIARGKGKWMVRQWAPDLIPLQVLARPKWGFRPPLNLWFRGPLRDYLIGYLTRNWGLCATYGDPAAIGRLIDSHMTETVDASDALWTLLAAEVWYQDVYLSDLKTMPLKSTA